MMQFSLKKTFIHTQLHVASIEYKRTKQRGESTFYLQDNIIFSVIISSCKANK
jgi:hypothetical protein